MAFDKKKYSIKILTGEHKGKIVEGFKNQYYNFVTLYGCFSDDPKKITILN